MDHTENFLEDVCKTSRMIDKSTVDKMIVLLAKLRERGGRLFFLGVGGSAANCSHAVNDFRKIAGIEAYSATDNVSELTARINDDGWDGVFMEWLKVNKLKKEDMIFILSVGGGDPENNVSNNLVVAMNYAKEVGCEVVGIVSRNGGYTAKVADACVIIPVISKAMTTPHAEAFQAVIWHLMIMHPLLQVNKTKWESVTDK